MWCLFVSTRIVSPRHMVYRMDPLFGGRRDQLGQILGDDRVYDDDHDLVASLVVCTYHDSALVAASHPLLAQT